MARAASGYEHRAISTVPIVSSEARQLQQLASLHVCTLIKLLSTSISIYVDPADASAPAHVVRYPVNNGNKYFMSYE